MGGSKRFMVVFSSPDKPMLTCTIHNYEDSQGEIYTSRVFRLEDEGLIIYDQMQTRGDLVMPATDILSQLMTLISRFAEENDVTSEDIHYSTRVDGKPVKRQALELSSAWKDPTLIRKIQKTWSARKGD